MISSSTNRLYKLLPFLLLMALVSGCATVGADRAPGANLDEIQSIHVVKLDADGRGVDRIIADQLQLMGYAATHGSRSEAPEGVDAILTYQDNWTWDITMYMIRLQIQIRDPETEFVMASAESYRPSLQRRSPEQIAKEALDAIFGK